MPTTGKGVGEWAEVEAVPFGAGFFGAFLALRFVGMANLLNSFMRKTMAGRWGKERSERIYEPSQSLAV